MRFWLFIIITTVLMSGGVTWLYLHQGTQLEEGSVLDAPTSGAKLEFDDARMVSNVIELAPGDSKMNEVKAVVIPFHNAGTGPVPLKLSYERSSCKCLDGVSIDDVKLAPGGRQEVSKAPGEKGLLRIQWKPTKETCEECDKKKLLIAVEFRANDPRPQFANNFRFEIHTRVADAAEHLPAKP